jgi:Tol biopolymer transport system component
MLWLYRERRADGAAFSRGAPSKEGRAVNAWRSTRLRFPRPSSVGVLMLVAATLAVACVALVVLAQEPARATFPGKNGKIAVVRGDADGTAQIFTVSPSGANLKQITFGKGDKLSPAWSADGRKIAFVKDMGGPRQGDIYTMDADGSDQAVITRNRKDDSDPSWSPDGRRLVFERLVTEEQPETGVLENRELFAVDSDGTDPVRLTRTPEESELDPAWSPDGTQIAFSTFTDAYYFGYGRIYVMKADGSGPPAMLPPFLDQVSGLGWSPDGQWLAFSSGGPRSSSIIKMRADGSEAITLVSGGPYGCFDSSGHDPHSPEWSPDGKQMVFFDNCNGVVTMDADGEHIKSIGVWVGQFSWQPVVR